MTKLTTLCVTTLLAASMLLTGCETPGQGAKNGALIGAGVGALTQGTLRGAALGAGIGAAGGALAGKANQDERRDRYYREYPDDAEYTGRGPSRDIPYARLTNRNGFVTSPYRPYNLIDVRGIPQDARVVDPSCDRVFLNP